MIDPRRLRPSQLVQLLNSTPLGEVANERTLYRHRARAGLRIGDGRTVDLLRYVAWLVLERHRPKAEPEGPAGYEAHRERAARRNREMSLLGRDKHPQWQGERTKMVYAFPTNEALWAKYAEIRAEGLRNDRGIAAATEFYREHREEMDEGAVVAWPERYNPDEISAIQPLTCGPVA